jgi:hypothetical protein
MHTTNYQKFKGEIENYVRNGENIFESRIDRAFSLLNIRTHLSRTKIKKDDGYPAAHLLFILTILPLLKIKTINSFCQKQWYQWSVSGKDAFYRFKQKPYRWRTFMYKVINKISGSLNFERFALEDLYYVIDDTVIAKRGRNIENVSFIHDHNLGRSVLGFCVVTLGLFTGENFYPVDFAYRFGKTRHPKSSKENIGDPRSMSGQRSYEAKHQNKIDLALSMIQTAYDHGIRAGYVLFDSWYAWPKLINAICEINKKLHVICRLKDSKVLYEYKGKKYRLSELYQKVKSGLKKDSRTGLLLKRVVVKFSGSDRKVVIIFSKGYSEPEENSLKGAKKVKEPKWVAFLSTNITLHASTIIKKYTKRWTVEVCFKECKQLLGLGKDQCKDFNAQVFSTTISFMRYNFLNFLNEQENFSTIGNLFNQLADESAIISYAQRLWDFFRGLFQVSFAAIFNIFKIEEDCSSYFNALTEVLCASTPIQGCET